MVTPAEIHDYAASCGSRAAADLLLMYGPDNFHGDYDAYLTLSAWLEYAAAEGQNRNKGA